MSLPSAGRAILHCCQTELDLTQDLETDSTAPHFLLFRCAQGNHATFKKIYNTTKGKIFGTTMMILKHRELAEEVVRETYLRIWAKSSTYNPPLGSAIAWMATIKRNLAIDVVRLSNSNVGADEGLLTERPTAHPSALEQIEFSQNRTYPALENLDEMSRGLIIAAYLHVESRGALSARFGVPVDTVKTWIRSGLLAARACLMNADGLHRTVA